MDAAKRSAQRPTGQKLTRKRIPLSCEACRIRKLKCNREKPCQNCIVRGESNAASCSYAEKANGKHSSKSNPRKDAEDMRKRINRLEKSILSVMEGDKISGKTPESPLLHVTEEDGMNGDEDPDQAGVQTMYTDTRSTHWDAILNDLGAMKDAWSEENDQIEPSNGIELSIPKAHRPSLLTGMTPPPDRATILESLPSKEAADKLLVRFFGYYNPAVPAKYAVHKATFLKQYNNHWADPTKTKIIWVGLLFSILFHALASYRRNKEEPPEYQGTSNSIMDLYRVRTAQCLLIADFRKPVKFMVETMLLYIMAEYSYESDGDPGSWLLSGQLVRIALKQGYHRDPSHNPNISVFDGEMRRRLWTGLSQNELLGSVKIGLPKGFRYEECDTRPASNLYDHELYEDMKELPPSRPMTECTEISYFITKYWILRAYGHVVDFLHIVQPQPWAEVMKLDLMLIDQYEAIPAHFQIRTLEEMRNDPPSRIMERYFLQLFYHKAICLLHRKFWNVSPSPDLASYSRKRCVDSSIALLDQQAEMHRACQPGGLLVNMKWHHFAITNHDFLLAVMILCLDLMLSNQIGTINSNSRQFCVNTENAKLNRIKQSRAIWAEVVEDSKDAKRAVHILTSVLNKLIATIDAKKAFDAKNDQATMSTPVTNFNPESLSSNLYFTDQFSLGMLPGAEPTLEYDTIMQDGLFTSGGLLDTLGTDVNLPTDFDWDTWDQLLATKSATQGFSIDF